jgi:hypothetical protein
MYLYKHCTESERRTLWCWVKPLMNYIEDKLVVLLLLEFYLYTKLVYISFDAKLLLRLLFILLLLLLYYY